VRGPCRERHGEDVEVGSMSPLASSTLKMRAATRIPSLWASSMIAAYCAGVTFWALLPVVDPGLDDPDLSRRILLDRLAAFIFAVDLVRRAHCSCLVMPRPALKNRAAPRTVPPRIGNNSRLSVPRLSAALTPNRHAASGHAGTGSAQIRVPRSQRFGTSI
jgi:hypothetical protein